MSLIGRVPKCREASNQSSTRQGGYFAVARNDMKTARLASLRQLQSEMEEELDALLPSVLDRVFKGEL